MQHSMADIHAMAPAMNNAALSGSVVHRGRRYPRDWNDGSWRLTAS
jgi:hypothetical protein